MRIPGRYGFILSASAAIALSACTIGTEFVRPPADFVRLGETTRAQIIERFGKPQEEQQVRSNSHLLRSIAYFFGSETEPPKVPGTVCVRLLYFMLSDDIVVGEGFQSNCAADHTDFDESRSGEIVKDKSRCDDVIAIMGRPSARAVYPAVEKKGELNMGYTFKYMARPGGPAKNYTKQLEFLCDSDGIVREILFREFGSR